MTPEKEPYDLTRNIALGLQATDLVHSLQIDISQITSGLDVMRSVANSLNQDTQLTTAIKSITEAQSVVKSMVIDNRGIADALRVFDKYHERFAEQLRETLATFDPMREFLPENLRESTPSLSVLQPLLLDEGIPLMWVPGPTVVKAILEAPDASARRRIIGNRWKSIVNNCEAVTNTIDHPELLESRQFTLDCVAALRAGHPHPAQALTANLLDSLMRAHFRQADREKLTVNRRGSDPFDLNEYSARIALTLAPVWNAHAEYRTENGDPIPRVFGRHPSAHGVSRRQYSRVNAIYGLMLVTSVMKLLNAEMDR